MNTKTPKMTVLKLSILVITMIILSLRTVYPQDKIPEKEADTCISSKCHTTMGKDKFVHGAVAEGQCIACHGKSAKHKDSPKRYTFELIEEVGKKCYSCHEKYETKKFKGFIPAVFGKKVGNKLYSKSGITIKQTSLKYRNEYNQPDEFEVMVLKKMEDYLLLSIN